MRVNRHIVLVGLSVVALTVGTPVAVLVATGLGAEPNHWSGVALVDIESPLSAPTREAPPEPAAVLLDRAARQDENDTGDLAPSWWDASSGTVALGAATGRGEQMRRMLAEGQASPYRIERHPHSSRDLTAAMHAATDLSRYGASMTSIDAEHNRVLVGTRRPNHDLFSVAASRFGDTVAVVHTPLRPEAYLDGPPPDPSSWWSLADPPRTWLTLATGFPWYLGTAVLVVAVLWVGPRLPGRRRDAPVDASPPAS
jgi:hypothetical protein